MDNDPGIICFRHCSVKNIFCKTIPETCPVCSLGISNYIVEPFRIPYPFINAIHNPTSIVIRPSVGSFLEDYDVTYDLHIGITNSKGNIFEFDKNGLIINDVAKWKNCIVLKIVPASWTVQWDETLQYILEDLKWNSVNYHIINMNCFDFILEFFNHLGYVDLKFASKEDLCEKLILSKFQNAMRYISLYKALKNEEFLLSDNTI